MINGYVVPIGEIAPDPDRAHGVVPGEILERFGREHDTPAERVVGAIALDDRHVVRAVAQLHRYGKVEAGRSTAENRNLHRAFSSPLRCIIAPSRNYFKLEISRMK